VATVEVTFTALVIASIVGFVLSFLVENIPSFAAKWNTFAYKGLAIAGSGLAVCIALVILGYAGAPVAGVPTPFIWDGLWTAIGVYIAYLMATQTAYQLQAGNLRRKQEPEHDESVSIPSVWIDDGKPELGSVTTTNAPATPYTKEFGYYEGLPDSVTNK